MLTVYGIPSCGTVKKARAWLEERGVDHQFIDFRTTPLPRAEIEAWVAALGSQAMRNTSGGSYRALPATKQEWSEAQWAEQFAADPMLIKRPIITGADGPLLAGFRGSDQALALALGLG